MRLNAPDKVAVGDNADARGESMQSKDPEAGQPALPRGLAAAAQRRARQAAALRDNLARRKAQGRLRADTGQGTGAGIAATKTILEPGHD